MTRITWADCAVICNLLKGNGQNRELPVPFWPKRGVPKYRGGRGIDSNVKCLVKPYESVAVACRMYVYIDWNVMAPISTNAAFAFLVCLVLVQSGNEQPLFDRGGGEGRSSSIYSNIHN